MESCAYRWHVVKDHDNKKYTIRHHKSISPKNALRQAKIFKWQYEFKEWPTFAGHISTDTSHDAKFIEFDTNRVYLFTDSKEFSSLFTSGVLSDQMIYCAMDSLCLMNQPFDTSGLYNNSFMIENERRNYLKHFDRDVYGWRGNALEIFHIEQFYGFNPSPTTRRFELWVSNMRWSGGDGHDVLYLEVTNKSGRKRTSLKKFLNGAQVTFIKRVYIMI